MHAQIPLSYAWRGCVQPILDNSRKLPKTLLAANWLAKINEKVRALSAYRSLAWKFSSSLLIIHLFSFTVKWLYTMQLPQAPGEQKHFHQATEENVRGLWWRARALSFSHSPRKTKRATALILVCILATVCYAREGRNGPDNLLPRVLFICLLRDEERLGKVWTTKLALVGKLACPPFPYCKLQMLFTVLRRWQN